MKLGFVAIGVMAPLLLSGVGVLGSEALGESGEISVLRGHTFGTHYEISLRPDGADGRLETMHADIRVIFDRVDRQMSTWREDSELNRLSQHPVGEWMAVSDPLFDVLATGQRIARETDGAFDMTIGELIDLWGFGPAGEVDGAPGDYQLASAVRHAGYEHLELDEQRLTARRLGMFRLDLSAIAKGHGVDQVARYLDDQGITHYLINVGGDMYARGLRAIDRPWQVALEVPDSGVLRQPYTIIPVTDIAVATSGSYRDFIEHGGRRYTHVIDPRTGQPVDHALVSATVLNDSAALADAYATGLLVLGSDAAAFAASHDLKVILVKRTESGFVDWQSPAMKAYLAQPLH